MELTPENPQVLRLGVQVAGILKDKKMSDKVLILMTKYNKENLTAAMEIVLEQGAKANKKVLIELLENEKIDILAMRPIKVNLYKYDELLTQRRKENGAK